MGKWDKELEGIVKTASAAASDEGRWNDVLTGLCRRFGATGAALITPQPAARNRIMLAETGLPPGGLQTYFKHWADQDPWFAGAAAKRIEIKSGLCVIGSEVCDRRDLVRTPFYNEFLVPQGVQSLMTQVVDDGSQSMQAPLTILSLYRGPRLDEFSRDDQHAFKSVHAVIRLALREHWSLGAALQGERTAMDAFAAVPKPLLVLAADGCVLHANPAGATLLARRSWIGTSGTRVNRLGQLNTDLIGRALSQAIAGVIQALPLWRAAGGRVWTGLLRALFPCQTTMPAAWRGRLPRCFYLLMSRKLISAHIAWLH